ncbi:helix-turn-helix domain-containing protein [Aquabacterium sp. OR-4]|uniref:helix-turn-helix domain-containing protein n=1 Tax=Aquabacterium sp. OR-4 TaxID=2978127 RepID=UPI0021B2D8F3|nr:helix-turn-helix domain-containing protein [Aquabacterium sp. OR-4]MDT7836301.1 helix-turn-helix domain-containing protein [Aquabacterium sp. OR-4]
MARRLQRLALGDASRHSEDRRVLRITQDMLAMMIGITRQTLALELKAMAQAGAIRIGYRRIEILSMTQLDELAACPGPTDRPGLLRPAAAPCPGASPGG